VDFSVGAEKGALSAEVYIKNAFHSDGQLNCYISCGSTCQTSYPGLPEPLYIVPVQPLTVGVKFGQKF
jgi:hypothetical protein